jgi:thiol:disulfide interchange protein
MIRRRQTEHREKLIALLFLAFGLYLLPGLTNTKYANLGPCQRIPPPCPIALWLGGRTKASRPVVNDYQKALELAKEEHKPLLIDFTGWACVNCRKMEENVWPKAVCRN